LTLAHPEHVEALDGLDRLTVRLYRAGFAVLSTGLLALAGAHALWPEGTAVAQAWVLAGAVLSAADVHLYDKRIRWFVQALVWFGLWMRLAFTAEWLQVGGLGFVFAGVSGLALKEQFCFRIPGLRAVPLLLAASLLPMWKGPEVAVAVPLGLAGVILAALTVAKARQPLHFDIGDKSYYQI
jgi:uncharacterized integral membrane protein